MERLTEWDEFGNADIIALSDMMPEIYAELSFDETNALTEALNRLAAYEDTGLEPDEINSVFIHDVIEENKRLKRLAQAEKDGRLEVLPPNDPLTLEELREMDGEPVWVQYGQYDGEWLIVAWNIYDAISYARKAPFKLSVYSYGDTWLAYHRKPEEV